MRWHLAVGLVFRKRGLDARRGHLFGAGEPTLGNQSLHLSAVGFVLDTIDALR